MKSILFTSLFLIFSFSIFAQECMSADYLKKGTKWEMTNYNKKGKKSGLVQYEVLNTNHTGSKNAWEIQVETFDKKDESLNKGSTEIVCEDGVYKMDMSQMIPSETLESLNSMEVEMEGTMINFPTSENLEFELEDGYINIAAATSGMVVMSIKISTINRKIEGLETVETEAGTFQCLKITQDTKMENKIISRTYSSVSWFLTGFGVVKNESYDHKGKFMGSSILSSLTR